MTDFLLMLYEDCGETFIKKLDNYIDKEKELNRNVSRLEYAIKIREALRVVEKTHSLK